MSNLIANLRPFAPLLLTFFLPRAINLYRTAKVAYKTRPPTRPLPADAARALNLLFFGVCLFVFQTLPTPSWLSNGLGLGLFQGAAQHENIFSTTGSRLKIPTDVLFARLALARPGGLLTSADEVLKSKIGSLASRALYLKYGPATLQSCSFCSPSDIDTYLFHYLPLNVLLPHLLHIFLVGLATSLPFSGPQSSTFRVRLTIFSIALLIVDIYTTISWTPRVDLNQPSPTGPYWTLGLLRPLLLSASLLFSSLLIYASSTNRFAFILFPILPSPDAETTVALQSQKLNQATLQMQMAHTRLNAYSITRHAVVRDPTLKSLDDRYWRAIASMEGHDPDNEDGDSIWQDEEVQAAISRVLGGTGSAEKIEKMNRDARTFVGNVTKGIERG